MPGNVKWVGFGHCSFQFPRLDLHTSGCSTYSCLLYLVQSVCVCVTRALGAWACCSQGGRAIRNVLIILLFGLWSPKFKCTACICLGPMHLWWFLVGAGELAVYSSPASKARCKAEQVTWQASGRSLGIRARAWSRSWTSGRILKPWLDSFFFFF